MKIAISGICGKMGQRIAHFVLEDTALRLVLGLEYAGHPDAGGVTAGGVAVVSDPEKLQSCDCLIEFTAPGPTIEHLDYLTRFSKAAVIGTTGLSPDDINKIAAAAQKIPIVFSPNMSVGINLIFRMLKDASRALSGYSASLSEAHHIHKKDSPSGTAKKMVDIINSFNFKVKYEDVAVTRQGEIIGDHAVTFESPVDTIGISHHAKTRDIFAQGALVAAKWLAGKKPGLYSMEDVLFGNI